MKATIFFLLATLLFTCNFEQAKTSGDNSPAVIAKNFSAIYGVRADAVEAILMIYEAEGYDVDRRKRATEQVLIEYTQAPDRQQKIVELSKASDRQMRIANAPQIANALEWDLFARKHYLSTTGHNSPAVAASGDVSIWYGIPAKTLRALAEVLENNQTDLSDFETQLTEQVKKYKELKTELQTYGSQEEIYRHVEALLEEGKLEEAERLIESDFDASMKRQAYKGYIYGKTKELLLKYEESAKGYKNAVQNDETNATYHLYYANNENTLAHYDEAIRHYEIALGIDSLKSGNEERIAVLINNLGFAWKSKEAYDKAVEYYEEALQIDLKLFDKNHPSIATCYNNLGGVWYSKGAYDKAAEYYEEALQIDLKLFDETHPNIATCYNSLGGVWYSKGDHDKALVYYEKALKVNLKAFGEVHPNIAVAYNNIGFVWNSKGANDKAIEYYEEALHVNLKLFDETHPNIATCYNNLGAAWNSKGEYDKAIDYFGKALQIDLQAFGENHTSVATGYNNLGGAWDSKGEYDKAIDYFGKALQVFLNVLGETHPNIATCYNNLGGAWHSKGAYNKAIDYFGKALQVDLQAFGENHPSITTCYNNLGTAWDSKGVYDKAIEYYEKAQIILDLFFESTHPKQKVTAENILHAANDKGMELFSEKKYHEALAYFQKALKNVNKANDATLSLNCMNNIGSTQKQMQQYEEGLQSLDEGLQLAAMFNQQIDQVIQEKYKSKLANSELQAVIDKLRKYDVIRQMQYHKVGCLKGLERNKEAKALARQLWQESIEADDGPLLEDLKKEGYNFGK